MNLICGCQILTEEQLLSRHLLSGVIKIREKHKVSRVRHAVLNGCKHYMLNLALMLEHVCRMRLWATLTWTAACLSIAIPTMHHKPIFWDAMHCRPRKKRHVTDDLKLNLNKWKVFKKKKFRVLFIWFVPTVQSLMQKNKQKKNQAEEQQRSTALAVVRNNTERLWTGAACWVQWCYLHLSRGTYWQRGAA